MQSKYDKIAPINKEYDKLQMGGNKQFLEKIKKMISNKKKA